MSNSHVFDLNRNQSRELHRTLSVCSFRDNSSRDTNFLYSDGYYAWVPLFYQE